MLATAGWKVTPRQVGLLVLVSNWYLETVGESKSAHRNEQGFLCLGVHTFMTASIVTVAMMGSA